MTDIEIANRVKPKNIIDVAKSIDIDSSCLELYGNYKAKVNINKLDPKGKLILVTSINPTPSGEGKTTVSIGLADAFTNLNKKVCLALREPSLGPVFGMKGGATGGGYSQVIPMEDINLHFTGDFHAITSANNLLCSFIDNHIYQGNELNINPDKIIFNRCMDLNDRALRTIDVCTNDKNGTKRSDRFNITAASEVMAILCLSTDMFDLKTRLGNIIVAYNYDNEPIYAKDLKAENAMAILLKDAIKPNLVQTLIGTPALIHGGPFANIAHGCNTITATKLAMSKADYTITEAGFGADLGAEKFLDTKCRIANLSPNAVVIVATIKALKYHGGVDKDHLSNENISALKDGAKNLLKHIYNIKSIYHLPIVVAINRFTSDTLKEIDTLISICNQFDTKVVLCDVWAKGGKGAIDLAKEVIKLCEIDNSHFEFAYDLNDSIKTKIEKVAKNIYGAGDVMYSAKALSDLKQIENLGYSNLPIIIAKTQYSLSDNPKLHGAPKGFNLNIKEIQLRSGAGFIVAIAGSMLLMPGLSKEPAGTKMSIDNNSNIYGLF